MGRGRWAAMSDERVQVREKVWKSGEVTHRQVVPARLLWLLATAVFHACSSEHRRFLFPTTTRINPLPSSALLFFFSLLGVSCSAMADISTLSQLLAASLDPSKNKEGKASLCLCSCIG